MVALTICEMTCHEKQPESAGSDFTVFDSCCDQDEICTRVAAKPLFAVQAKGTVTVSPSDEAVGADVRAALDLGQILRSTA